MVCVYPAHANQQLRRGVAQTHEQEGQRRETTILCADPPIPQRGQATANPDEVGARYQRKLARTNQVILFNLWKQYSAGSISTTRMLNQWPCKRSCCRL